ncbi:MAG: RDD family protein [Bacilli bacterium]|nr:RDD family protein [Clostridium sp.]MDY6015436.1 RDD family protein [Bacilli bacterium]
MPAQFNKRFFAYIIDIFIVLVIANLITMFIPISEKTQDYYKELQTTQKKMYDKEIDVKEYTDIVLEDNYNISKGTVLISLTSIIIYILYFVVYQVYNNGQTVGKKLMKIKVKSITDESLSINTMLFRALIIYGIAANIINLMLILLLKKELYLSISNTISIIQSLIVIISVFMILFSKQKRGIHDIITKTEVVNKED